MTQTRPLLLLLAALGTVAAAGPPARQWEIGPVIRGESYSPGMPASPSPTPGGWSFDFPGPDARAGHVHSVSFDPRSLAGARRIVVRYRIDAAPGARFVAQETPGVAPTVSVMVQRAGDNWSARGRYAGYRWYAPGATLRPVQAGVGQMVIDLADPGWTSVVGQPRSTAPGAFRAAMEDTGRIAVVFGTAGARGHGVYATRPARFTLTGFDID